MSFDLKAAREICSRIKGYEDPDGGNFADFQAAEMLPAALDEIERQAKRIAELEEALVEERARRICHAPSDPVGHWSRYEKVVVDEAREQLRLEGKL